MTKDLKRQFKQFKSFLFLVKLCDCSKVVQRTIRVSNKFGFLTRKNTLLNDPKNGCLGEDFLCIFLSEVM